MTEGYTPDPKKMKELAELAEAGRAAQEKRAAQVRASMGEDKAAFAALNAHRDSFMSQLPQLEGLPEACLTPSEVLDRLDESGLTPELMEAVHLRLNALIGIGLGRVASIKVSIGRSDGEETHEVVFPTKEGGPFRVIEVDQEDLATELQYGSEDPDSDPPTMMFGRAA